MRDRVHLTLLRIYRRLPVAVRRQVVRLVAPTYSVGAMAFIERSDGALLLVRHSYRQRWGVPGGLLERHEDPRHAVRREVVEEVGLRVELLGEPAVVVDAEPHRIDLVFRARPTDGTDPVPSSPEIVDAAWFLPDALPELQFETRDALMTLSRSARAPQARPLSPGDRDDRDDRDDREIDLV